MKTKVISKTDWVEIYYDENNNISDIIHYTDKENIIYPTIIPFINTTYMLKLIEDDIIEFIEISLKAYENSAQMSKQEEKCIFMKGGSKKILFSCATLILL